MLARENTALRTDAPDGAAAHRRRIDPGGWHSAL